MLGLVNRSLRSFLRDLYGEPLWQEVLRRAQPGTENFEALLLYDDAVTYRLLAAASDCLGRPEASLLEDFGQWLVTSQTGLPLRRLLRFGGREFADFLHSLEELADRARLALPMVRLPAIQVSEYQDGAFRLRCEGPGAFIPILAGAIAAMADDYGALMLMESQDARAGGGEIILRLHAAEFSSASRFDLAGDMP